VTRQLVLRMDEFGRQAVDAIARRRRGSQSAAVRTASLYYLADRDADRPAWRVPAFVRDGLPKRGDGLQVALDDDTWRAVSEEADRQNVSGETLLRHALLYLHADLESGRLPGHLDDALDEVENSLGGRGDDRR
jgi:hypothetical protein